VLQRTEELGNRPLSDLSFDEIDEMFFGFAEICRQESVRGLDQVIERLSEGPLKAALRLMYHGTDADIVRELLKTGLDSVLREQETRHRKVLAGVKAMQVGTNPRLLKEKLSFIY